MGPLIQHAARCCAWAGAEGETLWPLSGRTGRGPRTRKGRASHGLWAASAAVATVLLLVGCNRSPRQAGASGSGSSSKTSLVAGKKVLLVQSYHAGYPWVDGITRGARMALSRSGVDFQVFHMDTKRKTGPEWKQQAGRAARKVLTDWQPDVVIAADDNAQEYLAKSLASKPGPSVVFCGVNAEPGDYGYPAPNVTGILERPHFEASLDFLAKLRAGATRIALVSDDSPTSDGALKYMRSRETRFQVVSCARPATFAAWQEAIRSCQSAADAIAIYMYHTVRPTDGADSMDPKEVMSWTVANSRLPIVGFFVFAVDDGALCGYLESGVEHGFKAGRMALEILAGKRAGDIPLVTALEGQSMLNLNTARKLGIHVPQEIIEATAVVIGK